MLMPQRISQNFRSPTCKPKHIRGSTKYQPPIMFQNKVSARECRKIIEA